MTVKRKTEPLQHGRKGELYEIAKEFARQQDVYDRIHWHAIGVEIRDSANDVFIESRPSDGDYILSSGDRLYRIIVPSDMSDNQQENKVKDAIFDIAKGAVA